MNQFLLFVFLLSGALFLSIRLKQKIEATVPTWIFITIIFIFVFGLFGRLEIGLYAVIGFAVLAFVYSVYSFLRYKKDSLSNILTPGLAVYFLLFILSWWGGNGRMFTRTDEFSHWGLTVKNMFLLDAFSNHPASTVIFQEYPPATALFQYLFTKMFGAFSEPYLYQALNVMYYSVAIFLFKDLKWKEWGQIMMRFIFVLVLPIVFYDDFYYEITVDAMLGIMFSYVLLRYYLSRFSPFNTMSIGIALFVLTIIKAAGMGLAMIAVLIMMADMLFLQQKKYIEIWSIKSKKDKALVLLLLASPLLFSLAGIFSWEFYRSATSTEAAGINISGISIENITNLLSGNSASYQTLTIRNFGSYLLNQPITEDYLQQTFINWIILFTALAILFILIVVKDKDRKQFTMASVLLLIGELIFSLMLLLLYLFSFGEYEAVRLASASRYLSTYLIGLLFFYISMITIKEHENLEEKKGFYTVVIFFFLLINTQLQPLANITYSARYFNAVTTNYRAQFEPIKQIEQAADPKKDKVYFISIGSDGKEYYVAKYIATPVELCSGAWSLGDPYFNGDIWTADISANEWKEILIEECTHVYVHRSNDYFNVNYGELFENNVAQNDTLYWIDKSGQSPLLNIVE